MYIYIYVYMCIYALFIYVYVYTYMYIFGVRTSVEWLRHMWDVTHSYVPHDTWIHVTRHMYTCKTKQCVAVCCSVLQCVAVHTNTHTLTYIRTHKIDNWHMWNDACTHIARLMHMCDMMHSYVWHNSFIRTHFDAFFPFLGARCVLARTLPARWHYSRTLCKSYIIRYVCTQEFTWYTWLLAYARVCACVGTCVGVCVCVYVCLCF